MTKAQALALLATLEGAAVPCSLTLTFPQLGVEQWNVQISPAFTVTGDQLGQLAAYCTQHGLVLTAVFTQLGVV